MKDELMYGIDEIGNKEVIGVKPKQKTLSDEEIVINYENCRYISGGHFSKEKAKQHLKKLKDELEEIERRFERCLKARKGMQITWELIEIFRRNIEENNKSFNKHLGKEFLE